MKMIKIQSLLMAASLSLFLFACKKESNSSGSGPSNADLQTQSDDENRVSNETDAAFDDVNTSMNGQASVTGASEAAPIRYGVAVQGATAHDTVKSLICDAVVTIDTIDNTRNLTITYNGGNCQLTRVRTGSIVVSWAKGVKWATIGATFTVTFNNLKITRVLDGKSITLNGTHTYTNVTGGNIFSLNANSTAPIIHTISSTNMSITFDNGAQRNWNIARQRSYSYNNGIVITETGTHTEGTLTGISEWGTNRFGNDFTVQIMNGLTVAQSCAWQLTGGRVELINAQGTTDITFGLNSTGQATSCPIGTGVYYFQLVWTGLNGKSYTFIMPY
ncbi:MAG TPA: hypothetical protein VHE34_14500 [Puia sp.]|uniref:hypothetical protein n=1 Tax=Puia sp. TaxID=2045100 RepID=UPI002B57503D|nr:hypothetical protein [Puia sp.]HVU96435.1 hypothetical protein [Puia sp.]